MRLPILKLENIPFWYKAVKRDTLFIALPFPPKFFFRPPRSRNFCITAKKPFRSGFSKTEGPERRFWARKCRAKKILFLREK
jgi:hypothetical protein